MTEWPQRVLMTADAVGGVWTYAIDLARALAGAGTQVMIAIEGPPPDDERRREAAATPGIHMMELGGRLEWMEGAESDLARNGATLLALARDFMPDIVHVNGYAHAAQPFAAPVVAVAHSCVRSWWRAVRGGEPPPAWDGYIRRVTAGLAAADVVVAPSQAFLAEIQTLYTPSSPCMVVHNGRDRARPVTAKEPFIMAAGRLWDEAKNIATLAAAAAELAWPVVLAGPAVSPDGAACRLDGIRLLGDLSPKDMERWLGRAAVFAAPARYEPFGLAPLEAALSGCALVLGDVPTLREIWGEAALYVPPDDRNALGRALRTLIADKRRRSAMAELARRRAGRYSVQAMTAGYAAVYRRAAAGRAARHDRAAGQQRAQRCGSPSSAIP